MTEKSGTGEDDGLEYWSQDHNVVCGYQDGEELCFMYDDYMYVWFEYDETNDVRLEMVEDEEDLPDWVWNEDPDTNTWVEQSFWAWDNDAYEEYGFFYDYNTEEWLQFFYEETAGTDGYGEDYESYWAVVDDNEVPEWAWEM